MEEQQSFIQSSGWNQSNNHQEIYQIFSKNNQQSLQNTYSNQLNFEKINLSSDQQEVELKKGYKQQEFQNVYYTSENESMFCNQSTNIELNSQIYQNQINEMSSAYSDYQKKKNKRKQRKQDQSEATSKKELDIIFSQNYLQQILYNKLSTPTKFYLFADNILDIDFLKSYISNQEEEYLKENQTLALFNNVKHINNLIHRMDNTFIEASSELFDQYLDSIEPMLYMINSLGHFKLKQISEDIQNYWNNLLLYRKGIQLQSEDSLFQQHKINRQKYSDKKFVEITKNLDPTKTIQYSYYKVNFEKRQLDDCRSGYSPALVELLAGNPYAFKQHLLKKGFIDPIHISIRLQKCFENTGSYISHKKDKKDLGAIQDYSTDIITLDNFSFPIILRSTIINLDEEYDKENQLKFNINNVLMIYEFVLQDQSVLEYLIQSRYNTLYRKIVNSIEVNIEGVKEKYSSDELLKKYYKDDVGDLLNKGNKWKKQCGFIEILPNNKKIKKNE